MMMENQASRVLIVDDMPINRLVLSSLLGAHGVLSDQVESGKECIELCEKKDYDLILLDHRMPDLDGVDTLMRLREIFAARGMEIPVVCHTTEDGRKNINLYKAAGFADVLIKPVDPGEMYEVLMKYLPAEGTIQEAGVPGVPGVFDTFEKDSEGEVSTESINKEAERLPDWIKIVPVLDPASGVTNCGSAEDYLDALYIFHSSIREKADDLQDFLDEDDRTMFELRIHSLKSMAFIVGAKKLGEAAASLEEKSKNNTLESLRGEIEEFLNSYREYIETLLPITVDAEVVDKDEGDSFSYEEEPVREHADHSRSILYIQNGQGVVKKGIEKSLIEAGFHVISIPDEPDRIILYRKEVDLILYYPGLDSNSHIGISMNLLGEICQDDAKILCLTGEAGEIEAAMNSSGSRRVSRVYPRPVDIGSFLEDMNYFAELEKDYHRTRTIFVVDDDPAFLSVIEHWLSTEYHVSCFVSGKEVMEALLAMTPDLILLDYEMPEIDGFALMKNIRSLHPETKIPIIFFTGKNDRDHVFHVLENKPDGYLLKTSGRDTLLDTIRRFFAETLFRMSL